MGLAANFQATDTLAEKGSWTHRPGPAFCDFMNLPLRVSVVKGPRCKFSTEIECREMKRPSSCNALENAAIFAECRNRRETIILDAWRWIIMFVLNNNLCPGDFYASQEYLCQFEDVRFYFLFEYSLRKGIVEMGDGTWLFVPKVPSYCKFWSTIPGVRSSEAFSSCFKFCGIKKKFSIF